MTRARVESHEQFAIRGVSAGVFVVQERQATAHHYDLRLEVDAVVRWTVPKGPSLDPAAERLAVEVEDHSPDHNDVDGTRGDGGVIMWDRGTYEQGGRVAWPEALQRGHAVFVCTVRSCAVALRSARDRAKPQWLLIKRRASAVGEVEWSGRVTGLARLRGWSAAAGVRRADRHGGARPPAARPTPAGREGAGQ